MAYNAGDQIANQVTTVYMIEAALDSKTAQNWTPLHVTATELTKKLATDPNRAKNAGMIDVSRYICYQDLGLAQAAFASVNTGKHGVVMRLVKVTGSITRYFQSGTNT